MGRRAGVSSVQNQIRGKRQAAGLSQQELARRCGLTRQAMNAIEADHYIPNTVVALRIARALGCRVEELFRLSEERPRVEAEWLGEAPLDDTEHTRIRLARVGDRILAHPLIGPTAFTAADGLTVPVKPAPHPDTASPPSVTVDLLIDAQLPEHTVVVLGCDPALALLVAHLAWRYPAFRLEWVPKSSLAALRMLGRGEAHAAGTHLWDPESGEYNLPYVRRELASRRLVVVTLSRWQQGLIVAHGNPPGAADTAMAGSGWRSVGGV